MYQCTAPAAPMLLKWGENINEIPWEFFQDMYNVIAITKCGTRPIFFKIEHVTGSQTKSATPAWHKASQQIALCLDLSYCFWSRPPWRLDTGGTGFQSLAKKLLYRKKKIAFWNLQVEKKNEKCKWKGPWKRPI